MPRVPRRDYSKRLAKKLRKSMSEAEVRLWSHLRRLPVKFRRQEPIGPYITDFCCYEARLVVEVDGSQHGDRMDYDRARDAELLSMGFVTLRIGTWEVMSDIDAVLTWIYTNVRTRLPPPQGEVAP